MLPPPFGHLSVFRSFVLSDFLYIILHVAEIDVPLFGFVADEFNELVGDMRIRLDDLV